MHSRDIFIMNYYPYSIKEKMVRNKKRTTVNFFAMTVPTKVPNKLIGFIIKNQEN